MRNNLAQQFAQLKNKAAEIDFTQTVFFLPGAFLVCLGLLALVLPELLVVAMAAFFVFCGLMICYFTWRALSWKRKFEGIFRDVSGRIVIKGFDFDQSPFEEEQASESKKIVYH